MFNLYEQILVVENTVDSEILQLNVTLDKAFLGHIKLMLYIESLKIIKYFKKLNIQIALKNFTPNWISFSI